MPPPTVIGNEDVLGGAPTDVRQIVALVEARDDVHVEAARRRPPRSSAGVILRIADDAQPFEVDPLDQVRALDVEPGDEAQYVMRIQPAHSSHTVCRSAILPSYCHRCGERKRSARWAK